MTCYQCRLPVLAAVPYFVGREQRYFCLRCEDGWRRERASRRSEPIQSVRVPDKRRSNKPFIEQLEAVKR